MIELQISHARKQMRSKRPDLALKELAAAGEWERADTPNADLRINQGLVGLRGGMDPQAEARLREGVDLAGGGAVGWFRAALQDALMSPPRQQPVALVGDELARALRGVPSKPDIVAIAALFSAQAVRADPKATYELGWRFCIWLRNAAHTVLSVAELHSVADAIVRAQLFDVLREFAVAGKRREPNERLWRFYEIVARTTNNPDRMSMAEEDEIHAMRSRPRSRRIVTAAAASTAISTARATTPARSSGRGAKRAWTRAISSCWKRSSQLLCRAFRSAMFRDL